MNLYKLTQAINTDYDTYDSCVVASENAEDAVMIRPDRRIGKDDWELCVYGNGAWANYPTEVNCKLIGQAVEGTVRGVILSSFNAG